MKDRREILVKLFNNLEVVHEHAARSCSILATLFRTLSITQLKMVLWANVRPLVQINVLGGLFNMPITRPWWVELPEGVKERVWLTMMADLNTGILAKDKINSLTCLLAAAFSYRVLKKFRGGVMQCKIQEQFGVRPKPLATCLTGRKYLSGMDQNALSRKCKASDDGSWPSTSK